MIEIFAGKFVESLKYRNGAIETGKSLSLSLKIIAGVQELGEFLSPRLNKRPKRCLATTLRASGLSPIDDAEEAFRLKHSKRRPCTQRCETDCCTVDDCDYYHF